MSAINKLATTCIAPTLQVLLPVWLIAKLVLLYRLRNEKSVVFTNLLKRKEEL
tara:strand:+ start:47 stop:205 length:159 start_codon:yes stop_codon:yes gene_type:complete